MNKIKFRPVGQPKGPITLVRVSQTKRAIYGAPTADGIRHHRPQGISKGECERKMLHMGFVRAR